MMSFWVMLDDSINTDELLAGAGAAALAAFFAELVTYQAATRFRMRIEWLAPAFSLPGQVVRDMVIVYHALWCRVAHGEQPPSEFLELPARFGDDRPEGVTRRTLLVGGPASRPTRLCSASTRTGTSWWCTGSSQRKRSHDMVMAFVAAAIAMLVAANSWRRSSPTSSSPRSR